MTQVSSVFQQLQSKEYSIFPRETGWKHSPWVTNIHSVTTQVVSKDSSCGWNYLQSEQWIKTFGMLRIITSLWTLITSSFLFLAILFFCYLIYLTFTAFSWLKTRAQGCFKAPYPKTLEFFLVQQGQPWPPVQTALKQVHPFPKETAETPPKSDCQALWCTVNSVFFFLPLLSFTSLTKDEQELLSSWMGAAKIHQKSLDPKYLLAQLLNTQKEGKKLKMPHCSQRLWASDRVTAKEHQ